MDEQSNKSKPRLQRAKVHHRKLIEDTVTGVTGYAAAKNAQERFCRAQVAIFCSRFCLSLLIYSIHRGKESEFVAQTITSSLQSHYILF
jgi:hypothetical protein